MQLIAIGGAIGTDYSLGAGQTIAMTGPSILLTYIIIGSHVVHVYERLR